MNEYEISKGMYYRDKILTVNNLIVAANVIVFLITLFGGNVNSGSYLFQKGGLTPDSVINGQEYYRIWTSMFLHSGERHLFSNMLVLFFIGDLLERSIGHVKYLVIYVVSGIIGSIVSMYFYYMQGEPYVVCVGASGAIFGVIGAMVYVLLRNKGRVEHLSLTRMIIYIVLSIYLGFTTRGVSLSAHMGGMVSGFILALILYRKRGYYQ